MRTLRHQDLSYLCSAVYDCDNDCVYSAHETDILIRKEAGFTVLAVRGTEFSAIWPREFKLKAILSALSNIRDVIRDLRALPWRERVSKQWGHKGFIRSVDYWLCRFPDLLDKSETYVITGHSLGSGIASQLARRLKMQGYNVAEVVMFGEPKGHYFGSDLHYQEQRIPTTSYLNSNDWIKWAGFGRCAVNPIVLFPGISSKRESHDIDSYIDALSGRKSAQ